MHKIKSHKTVEQIAKKHRLDVSFVKNQLKMGIPIEHEHTKDKDLATDIALQHLDEIPDYYTRLKKMEASAKKEHKKFKDVKEATDGIKAKDYKGRLDKWFDDGGWVQTGGKYDGKPCAKQPGQATKPYCRDPDDRAAMSKVERNKRAAKKRREDPNPNRSGKAKMVTQESAGEKDACYKKVKSRYKVWPSAYASGALVKCRKVGASNWGTKTEGADGSALPDWEGPIHDDSTRYCPKCGKDETAKECKYGEKYWKMFSVPITLKSDGYDPNRPHPANEEKDHEYSMARSEISTIISAAKRLKKKMGKGEGNVEAWVQSKITKAADYLDSAADYVDSGEMKTESVSIEDANGNHYAEFIDIIKPKVLKATRGIGSALIGEAGVSFDVTHSAADVRKAERAKKIANLAQRGVGGEKATASRMAVSLPSIMVKTADSYEPDGEVIDEKCWDGYEQIGMKKKGKKLVPNCVKKEEYSNWREELTEDWQKVNRQDKTDGLSQKAVNAYRRENPGSKLQTAVTEKNPEGKRANRRSNFCSRMKGMKSKRTSAETARDPDSRINKALRRWRCK